MRRATLATKTAIVRENFPTNSTAQPKRYSESKKRIFRVSNILCALAPSGGSVFSLALHKGIHRRVSVSSNKANKRVRVQVRDSTAMLLFNHIHRVFLGKLLPQSAVRLGK